MTPQQKIENMLVATGLVNNVSEINLTAEISDLITTALGERARVNAQTHADNNVSFSFSYTSNGHRVGGIIVVPRSVVDSEQKFPVIIFNRGGNRDFGSMTDDYAFLRLGLFASNGYIAIASQYSGNSFSEGKDEFGGEELSDVENLYPILEKVPFADVNRIAMGGASRGGMMTYMLLTRVTWVKAAIIIAGLADLMRNALLRPAMQVQFEQTFGGSDVEKKKRSAVCFADKLPKNVPILILHGTADDRVSVQDALDMGRLCHEQSIPFEMHVFEGDDHFFSKSGMESNRAAIQWLKKWIG